ncbi:hypothetical protein RB195_024159 [Necator americanus]|uniref:Uncharacterized protein n=1 Tax=Necator americanus TaxID=51031 RepID=A0ABR1EM40_NECAM
MEELLPLARPVRRSAGVKVIKVKKVFVVDPINCRRNPLLNVMCKDLELIILHRLFLLNFPTDDTMRRAADQCPADIV